MIMKVPDTEASNELKNMTEKFKLQKLQGTVKYFLYKTLHRKYKLKERSKRN